MIMLRLKLSIIFMIFALGFSTLGSASTTGIEIYTALPAAPSATQSIPSTGSSVTKEEPAKPISAVKESTTSGSHGQASRPLNQMQKDGNANSISNTKPSQKRRFSNIEQSGSSNLPSYFSNASEHKSEIKTAVILPTDTKQEKLLLVRPGDTARIEITHSILAFPDESAPVVATISSGSLASAKLYGESILEPNSQRIFVEFTRVSFAGSTYEIKAKAITRFGGPGFIGEYHSQEGMFFTGSFLSSFVAAYFDAQVPRTTNAFGQVVDDRSVDAATKKALAAGAMSTADRFRQKLQKVPAFSELKGPISAEIIISETGQRL
jgi:hypothetical protein